MERENKKKWIKYNQMKRERTKLVELSNLAST